MVFKFLFIFSNGVSFTIPATSKIEAINIVESKFKKLFEKESVNILTLAYELDKDGKIICEY